jgi:hypothetical protein
MTGRGKPSTNTALIDQACSNKRIFECQDGWDPKGCLCSIGELDRQEGFGRGEGCGCEKKYLRGMGTVAGETPTETMAVKWEG